MQKKMRLLTCVLLVTLLVASFSVPAGAVASGSGTYDGCRYNWTVTRGTDVGTAGISTPAKPAYVKASVMNQLYHAQKDYEDFSYAAHEGYAGIYVTADNIICINGEEFEATIEETRGSFWIDGACIISEATDR